MVQALCNFFFPSQKKYSFFAFSFFAMTLNLVASTGHTRQQSKTCDYVQECLKGVCSAATDAATVAATVAATAATLAKY
jgi:hypothetical protein